MGAKYFFGCIIDLICETLLNFFMGYICCLIICFHTFLIRPHNVLFPFLFVEGKCRLKEVESEI